MKLSDARRARLLGLRWYVVMVEAGRETSVALLLKRLGYTAFVPVIWQRRRRLAKHHRKVTDVTRPLAPRYVLIGFADDPAWPTILDYSWIVAAVGINGKPSDMPEKVMKTLFGVHATESLVSETVLERPAQRRLLHHGKVAEVLRGALAGQLVTIEKLRGIRADVVPNAVEAPVPISVSVDNLELID